MVPKFQTKPRFLHCLIVVARDTALEVLNTLHSSSRYEGIPLVSAEIVNSSSYGGGNMNLARNSLALDPDFSLNSLTL